MNDDRAKSQQTNTDLSVNGLGDDLRSFLNITVQPEPTPRTRQLRATFRTVPGDTLPAHSPDPGARGGTVQSASGRPDSIAAPAARANDLEGWRAAIQQAGADARADGPAKPADQGSGRRRVRGRIGGGARGGKKEKSAKAGAASLRIGEALSLTDAAKATPPRVLVPTESERADARRLFREIGERFNENRKKSKTAAYTAYRHDLMANLDTLIMGGAIDLKEVTTVITNLELLTKETEAESTETPATVLGRWLRMSAEEVAGLEVAAAVVEELSEVEENETDELADELLDEDEAAAAGVDGE